MSSKVWRAWCAATSYPVALKVQGGMLALAVAMLLAGCQPQATTQGSLPTVPADIQTCFRGGPVKVPEKALTVAEVESLWKEDRIKQVVLRKCGQRFLAWYADLRKRWQ